MAQDTSKADAALQNVYLPVFREQVNQRALLLFGYSPEELEQGMGHANAVNGETVDYGGIIRDADKFEFAGRAWFWGAHTKRNESGTGVAEGGYIPLAGEQGFEDFTDTIKEFYKQFEITGYAMEVSERNVGTFVNLLTSETEGVINDARYELNRQGYGDGTGNLTEITADGANTVTVTSVQYLRVGMYIDLVNKSTDAILAERRKLTAINQSTKVCTYDGANVDATPGTHVVCVTGNWKKDINGLKKICDDGSTYASLHGVDSTAAGNEYWKGKKYDGGAAVIDEDQVQQLLDEIGVGGRETEIFITTRGVRRRYVNTLKAQKRFNDGMSVTLHGGWKAVYLNEVPLLYDDQCPKGFFWALRPSDFAWMWLGGNDFRWLRRDGKILRMTTGVGPNGEDKDNWRGTIYRYHDLACERRGTQGQIYNLADDAAKIMT